MPNHTRDLAWGADCDSCETRMDAGRAQLAAESAGTGPLLCGSCRDEERTERYRQALEQIRGQDWVENALDPQWAARIAKEALDG